MKIRKLLTPLLFAFALALAPSLPAQSIQPIFSGPVLPNDQEQLGRAQANGTAIFPTFSMLQESNFFLGNLQQGPGILIAGNQTTGIFNVSLQLISSPTVALGYYTGVGTGQTITQLTNKSTAVVMPAPCFTGTITMNNASLANAATVKFTVTDSAVAASDIVVASPQQGSITAAAAYFVTCNSSNGSFVVNVTNQGTTESDAIVLNFIVLRASGN